MKQKRKKIAIYSRKSRFTGKGESIANQIEECKKYCRYMLHMEDTELTFTVYEDEGYSGKNFERPAMKQLLNDLDQYDFFVCYRLDRVSRSVSDFSSFIKKLEAAGVEFISVSESFDTTKPMGRAMMNITSAFAELERDNINERIVDNMTALAKTGRWLGGTTPIGFESQKIQFERDGKNRSYFKLQEIPKELDTVKLIYHKYMELGSLTKLASYLMNQEIKSKNGVDFTTYTLKFILRNPVYCTADQESWEYFHKNQYPVFSKQESFDGSHGIIGYNKTNVNKRKGKQRFNDPCDWIIAVGEHKAAIPSSLWIQVQEKLKAQGKFAFRKARTNEALLSGLVFCSCGSPMRPKSTGTQKKSPDKTERRFSYLCEKKSRSKGGLCKQKNIQGNTLDEYVVSYLFEMYECLQSEQKDTMNILRSELDTSFLESSEKTRLEHAIETNQRKLNHLVNSVENATSEEVEAILFQRMEELSLEIRQKKQELEILNSQKETPNTAKLKEYIHTLLHFDQNLWNHLDYDTKKNIIELLIDRIEWDGTTATIFPSGISFLQGDDVQNATNSATPDVSTMNC